MNLIFDLDGTLVDSHPGILESLNSALGDSGYSKGPLAHVPVGPPLRKLIESTTNCCESAVIDSIVSKFKDHYDCSGFISTLIFDGVYDFLSSLYDCHFNLFIATNKRLLPTLKILDHLSISKFFKDVYAVDSFGFNYSSKALMLKDLIRNYSLESPIVYFGDRYDDYLAASENLITFCYPLWGYTHDFKLFPKDIVKTDLCAPSRLTNLLLSAVPPTS